MELIPSIGAFMNMLFVVGVMVAGYAGFRASTTAQIKSMREDQKQNAAAIHVFQEQNAAAMRAFQDNSTSAIRDLAKEVKALTKTVNELNVEIACMRTERKGDEVRLRRLEKG